MSHLNVETCTEHTSAAYVKYKMSTCIIVKGFGGGGGEEEEGRKKERKKKGWKILKQATLTLEAPMVLHYLKAPTAVKLTAVWFIAF